METLRLPATADQLGRLRDRNLSLFLDRVVAVVPHVQSCSVDMAASEVVFTSDEKFGPADTTNIDTVLTGWTPAEVTNSETSHKRARARKELQRTPGHKALIRVLAARFGITESALIQEIEAEAENDPMDIPPPS